MSIAQMLPEVQGLSRQDKIKLFHFLAQDLEKDEAPALEIGRIYPVWSPTEAFAAADTLPQVLEEEKEG